MYCELDLWVEVLLIYFISAFRPHSIQACAAPRFLTSLTFSPKSKCMRLKVHTCTNRRPSSICCTMGTTLARTTGPYSSHKIIDYSFQSPYISGHDAVQCRTKATISSIKTLPTDEEEKVVWETYNGPAQEYICERVARYHFMISQD